MSPDIETSAVPGGAKGATGLVILAVVVLVLAGIGLVAYFSRAKGPPAVPAETAQLVQLGKTLYGENCAACHGTSGKGDGPAAYLLLPRPRNFAEGKFKRKNTPPRNLPADADLFKTVSDGLLGSSMPPWKDYLTQEERWALVYYLKRELIAFLDDDTGKMVSLYDLDPPKAPLPVPKAIPATPENIGIGRGLYQSSVTECWTCHGRTGHGDGLQSQQIVNARGERIYPIDLTKGVYKLSSSNEEIFRRIRDGITLVPMYSMGEKLTDEEIWCLVHYVRSLVSRSDEEREMNEQRRRTIAARKVGELPRGPDDESWKKISASYIPLLPLWWRRDRIEGVFVKAVHNGRKVSIQLSWVDNTEDRSVMRTQDFHDGAAIQLSAEERPPFFAMGAKGGVVNIWHWKADWEVEQSIDRKYPNMVSDHYQYRTDSVFGEHDKTIKTPITKHDPLFLTGWGAGNPFSNPDRKTPIEDLNAGGLGTLTSQARNGQQVRGSGKWYKGFWRVTFTRELSAKDDGDVTLSSGGSVSVAFAVWNGSQMDRNGQKSVTIWHRLQLEQ